jgi:hypothetical protein
MTDEDSTSTEYGHVIATVGGSVDEVRVTLALYGDDLDPAEVSHLLGCQPTNAHRRGEIRIGKKTGHKTVYTQGAWFLSAEGRAPRTADDLTSDLLAKVSAEDSLWLEMRKRFDVQMRYGIFVEAWNRGFGLSREVIQRVARIHATLEFDIYANLEGENVDG